MCQKENPTTDKSNCDRDDDLLRPILTKAQMDNVVDAVKVALSDPTLRALSQRAVQAKIWHEQTIVASVLQELRNVEEVIRSAIFTLISKLVYSFNEHCVDVTLQRAGIISPSNTDNNLTTQSQDMSHQCLDAKERLYVILKEYGWIQDFFRRYPIHFYENSFQFVDRIPNKDLPVKVKVIGLGIGGSMAVSGLAKRGIKNVVGYEKRSEFGPSSVTSRYQNASWRAYDTAASMVNDMAYDLLIQNRQRIHVQQPNGTTTIHESDRVQIILGAAIGAALNSAREYGAQLHFHCHADDYYSKEDTDNDDDDTYDIVALFCGAHTASSFPGTLDGTDQIWEWPELQSECQMWLRVQVSDKNDTYCTRGGEIGAQLWHYTIESARYDLHDLERIRWNQDSQYKYNLSKLESGSDIGISKDELLSLYDTQRSRLLKVLDEVKEHQQNGGNGGVGSRFDYIFTNSPVNDHNRAKRELVKDTIVLEGTYTVEIKMVTNSTITTGDIVKKLGTKLVVLGGDACVPPNPLAAYGATLACEAAASLVLLATGTGHLNAILKCITTMPNDAQSVEWKAQIDKLKSLLGIYYEAKAQSETYFQFVQTLICNMYSLPPFY